VGFLLVTSFRGDFAAVNLGFNQWAASINSGAFTVIAHGISVAFDSAPVGVASVVVAAILFVAHHKKHSLLLLSAMGGEAVLVSVGKTLIASARPLNAILPQVSYSFPSGHVTGSIVFFGVLTYFAWKHWNSVRTKAATGIFYVAVVGVVGFDRMYLNVHWFSDVVGAVFLGACWLTFSILIFKHLLLNGRLQRFLCQNPKMKNPPNATYSSL
jgi:membrane-associated phospholipid phosphatase